MKLALHACCGPCLLEPYDALLAEADEVVVVYANPNIHPAEEYERRRDTMLAYADEHGIAVIEVEYDPALWIAVVSDVASDPSQRCRRCFALRLGQTAEIAKAHGCDAIATTLTVSPYQDAAAIREAGERVAAEHGLTYIDRDFTDRYHEATRRSRELGMYRQNYCGCILSDIEARQARARRKAERRAAKDAAAKE